MSEAAYTLNDTEAEPEIRWSSLEVTLKSFFNDPLIKRKYQALEKIYVDNAEASAMNEANYLSYRVIEALREIVDHSSPPYDVNKIVNNVWIFLAKEIQNLSGGNDEIEDGMEDQRLTMDMESNIRVTLLDGLKNDIDKILCEHLGIKRLQIKKTSPSIPAVVKAAVKKAVKLKDKPTLAIPKYNFLDYITRISLGAQETLRMSLNPRASRNSDEPSNSASKVVSPYRSRILDEQLSNSASKVVSPFKSRTSYVRTLIATIGIAFT